MADVVTLAEAKAHLRVTSSSEDAVIQGYLDAAHQHVEDYTGLVLEPREVVEIVDARGRLRSWPVQSVVSATYRDAGGIEQAYAEGAYGLASLRRPARFSLIGTAWPAPPGSLLADRHCLACVSRGDGPGRICFAR